MATRTPSTLTLSTTSQNIGSGITWTINESHDHTHKITYAFGSTSGYILGSSSSTSNTSTGTWTVPTSLANQIPNATRGSGTIYLYTYYGSTHVGTKSYSFTAKVPDTETWQPSIPNVTISDAGYRPTGITSYVQGKSKAKVVSSSTAQGGAYIQSYRVNVDGVGTYYGSNITSGYLTKSGTVTIWVRATDSRGYSRLTSKTITVVPYSPPKLTTYTARRSPNDQGTNLAASINFSISSIDNKNTKQYRIRYRQTGGTWVSLADSTAYYTRSTTHSATGVLGINNSYEVEFYLKDSYTSVTQTRIVGTAFQLLDFRASGKGMAIGKVSESDSFEVALPAKFNSTDFTMPNGRLAVYLSNTSNLNDVVEEWILGTNGSNYPSSGYWYVHTIMYSNSSQRKQIAYGYQSNDVYTRYAYQGTWRAWEKTVDSGSNTNGTYIKFSDGTMITYQTVSYTVPSDMVAPSTISSPDAFPATFKSKPVVSVAHLKANWHQYVDASIGGAAGQYPTTTSCAIQWIELTENLIFQAGYIVSAMVIAIGRWK